MVPFLGTRFAGCDLRDIKNTKAVSIPVKGWDRSDLVALDVSGFTRRLSIPTIGKWRPREGPELFFVLRCLLLSCLCLYVSAETAQSQA